MTTVVLTEREDSLIRMAKADHERAVAALRPLALQMTEVARRAMEIHEQIHAPMQRMIESMQPSLQMMVRLQESMRFTMPSYITSSLVEEPVIEMRREVTMSRTVELSDDALDILADKVAERLSEKSAPERIDLSYSSANGTLFNSLSGKQLRFEDKKRNKALAMFVRAKGWTKLVATQEELDSPTGDAARKVIAGVNARMQKELGIPNFIESRRGSGYRINPAILIQRT